MGLFGTDGIRGTFGDFPICEQFFCQLGKILAFVAQGGHFMVAKDTRASGDVLEKALCDGLVSCGAQVTMCGILPTPVLSMAAHEAQSYGIMLTASHNPYTDNGIKIFNLQGNKLNSTEELQIEKLWEQGIPEQKMTRGKCVECHDIEVIYAERLKSQWPYASTRQLVWDTANGATTQLVNRLSSHLNIVDRVGHQPNGTNINAGVGSQETALLAQRVVARGADLGVANDGDGDRVVFVDESGVEVDGDQVLILLALSGKHKRLVVTQQSNAAVDAILKQEKTEVVRCDVGDKNVWDAMQTHDAALGGESCGHIIFRGHCSSGDGIFAALQFLNCLNTTQKKLSSLTQSIPLYPKVSKNIKIKEKISFEQLKKVPTAIAQAEKMLTEGRVLVRYSGTEPKIRLLVEGNNTHALNTAMNLLEQAVLRDLC